MRGNDCQGSGIGALYAIVSTVALIMMIYWVSIAT